MAATILEKCHFDEVFKISLCVLSVVCVSVRPLVYTVCALLPAAYIIGLIFTLKTHSYIYDLHVGDGQSEI